MENAVRNIKGFLESKGVEWNGNFIQYLNGEGSFYKIEDKDFDGETLRNLRLQKKNSIAELSFLVSETLFLVFNKERSRLEADFSNEWKNYLSKNTWSKIAKSADE